MIVLVIGHIGTNAYEGRLRNGTGDGSSQLPNTPVLIGLSEQEIINAAKQHLKPSVVDAVGFRIEVREDDSR